MFKRYELHNHTNESDAPISCAELIERMAEDGVDCFALTDHNTVSGVPEFLESAKGKKVKAVAGIEISTDYGEKVRFRLALKKAGVDVFCSELVDYMQGRVKIEIGTEYYAPFKE